MPIAGTNQDRPRPEAPAGPDPSAAHEREDKLATMEADSERLLLMTMQGSLSLIGFGFTIYQIFSDAAAKTGLARASLLGNRVGICLLALGLILLAGGLWTYWRARRQLYARRAWLVAQGLIAPARRGLVTPAFTVAFLLLLLTLTILGAIGARFLR